MVGKKEAPDRRTDPEPNAIGVPSAEVSLGWMLASRANLRFTRREVDTGNASAMQDQPKFAGQEGWQKYSLGRAFFCPKNGVHLTASLLHALLDDARLTPNQRAIVSMEIHGMSQSKVDRDNVYRAIAETPVQFGSMFSNLGTKSPNIEMFWNGRWYPVIMHVQFLKNEKHLSKTVLIYAQLSI
jgi:hypothetical protein